MRISDWSSDVCSSDLVSGLNAAANLQDISGKLQIYLLYEFSRAEGTPGSEIEAEEWRFLQALIDFVGAPGANLCPLEFGSIPAQFSAHRSSPSGWLFSPPTYSEIRSASCWARVWQYVQTTGVAEHI